MKKISAAQLRVWLIDILFDIGGSALYAVGVTMFTAPNHIAPGGVTGVATLVNYLWGAPIGTVTFLINIPLLFLSYKFLGRDMTLKTIKSVIVMSVTLNIAEVLLPPYISNPLLAALFGGVGIGAGLAVIFMRGATTGGTDIAARLLQKKFPFLPIGRCMMLVDCTVLISSSFVYGRLESALYGMIALFTCSRVLDSLLYGLDVGRMVLIVSEKNDEIAHAIITDLDRGATLLTGKGAYSGGEKTVVLSAVRKNQFHLLKSLVKKIDPGAFIIVTEAGEIIGEGFKAIDNNHL